jgi:hypothetical protein
VGELAAASEEAFDSLKDLLAGIVLLEQVTESEERGLILDF